MPEVSWLSPHTGSLEYSLTLRDLASLAKGWVGKTEQGNHGCHHLSTQAKTKNINVVILKRQLQRERYHAKEFKQRFIIIGKGS